MKSKSLFPVLVLSTCLTLPLTAAEERVLLGKSYVQDSGSWYQVDEAGRRYQVDPRVITIKPRSGVAETAARSLHRQLEGTELRRASTGFVDVEIESDQDVFEVIDAYLASGLVEIAEPNTFGEYHAMPDDPQYGSQFHFPIMQADDAWDITTGSPDVIIAVLDSGTEFSHEDMGLGTDAYQNIWLNPGEDAWSDPNDPSTGNGIDDDMNGYVDDWKGYDFSNDNNNSEGSFFHGTAVAGAVAAKTHNGTGVAGMAGGWNGPGARLMIAGVGDSGPNGSVLDDAILYAAENGAHVVQLALSVGPSSAIDAAIQTAVDNHNMVIICSSGNSGATSVGYPSSNADVIAIGATDSSDMKASFSNHGPDVEVSAPGVGILMPDLNDGYGPSSGTSFSSPLTSGVVALMLAVNPNLTNDEVRQILHDTADKVGGYNYNWDAGMPGHSFELGYGRVNALSAVQAAQAVDSQIFADGFESGDTSAW